MEKKCELEKDGVRLRVLLIQDPKLVSSNPAHKLELSAKEDKSEWVKLVEDSLVSSITNQFLDSSLQLYELLEDCFLNKDSSLSFDVDKVITLIPRVNVTLSLTSGNNVVHNRTSLHIIT